MYTKVKNSFRPPIIDSDGTKWQAVSTAKNGKSNFDIFRNGVKEEGRGAHKITDIEPVINMIREDYKRAKEFKKEFESREEINGDFASKLPSETKVSEKSIENSPSKQSIIDAHKQMDSHIKEAQNIYDKAQEKRAAYIKKSGYPVGSDKEFHKLVTAKVDAEDRLNRLITAKGNLLPLSGNKTIKDIVIANSESMSHGGVLVGASHAEGGIDIKTPSGKIEVEGEEIIINKVAAKENCELLSEINQSAGDGVAFPCDGKSEHKGKAEHGAKVNKIYSKGDRLVHLSEDYIPKYSDWDKERIQGGTVVEFKILYGLPTYRVKVDNKRKGYEYELWNEDEVSEESLWRKKAEHGSEIPSNNYTVFVKSKLLNNILYFNLNARSLNNAIEIIKSDYKWTEIEWAKGFKIIETESENNQFFYEGIRNKTTGMDVGYKDNKIIFYGPNNAISFDFFVTFKNMAGIKVFTGGYLFSGNDIKIDVDKDFNFDSSEIRKYLEIFEGGGKIPKNIKTGTVLISKWMPQISLFRHAGIVSVENGIPYIYDNDPDNPINEAGGSPKRTNLSEYLKTKEVLQYYETDTTTEEIKSRSKKVWGKKFNWVTFNCETFIKEVTGEKIKRNVLHPIETLGLVALGATAALLIAEKGKQIKNENQMETGLMVVGRTQTDNMKIGEWLIKSDFSAEWNAEFGHWFFEEKEETYDQLESDLDHEFNMLGINARFEGVFGDNEEMSAAKGKRVGVGEVSYLKSLLPIGSFDDAVITIKNNSKGDEIVYVNGQTAFNLSDVHGMSNEEDRKRALIRAYEASIIAKHGAKINTNLKLANENPKIYEDSNSWIIFYTNDKIEEDYLKRNAIFYNKTQYSLNEVIEISEGSYAKHGAKIEPLTFEEWIEYDREGGEHRLPSIQYKNYLKLFNAEHNIVNQYEGKTIMQVWDNWNKDQRKHFLRDHFSGIPIGVHNEIVNKSFWHLTMAVKNELEKHVSEGSYAKGGPIPKTTMKNNYYYLKIGNIVRDGYNKVMKIQSHYKEGIRFVENSDFPILNQPTIDAPFFMLTEFINSDQFKFDGLIYETERDKVLLQMEIDNIKKEFSEAELKQETSELKHETSELKHETSELKHDVKNLTTETAQAKNEANVLLENLITKTKGFENTMAGVEAIVTKKTQGDPWQSGKLGDWSWEAKVYNGPSSYGINNGRVSKLLVHDPKGKWVMNYDRGWEKGMTAKTPELKKVLKTILALFPVEGENAAKGKMVGGKKEQVKIMGHTVTVGTQKHAELVQQKKIFDQNAKGETGTVEKGAKVEWYGINYNIVYEKPDSDIAWTEIINAQSEKEAREKFAKKHPTCSILSISEQYAKGGKVGNQKKYNKEYEKMYKHLMDNHTSPEDFNKKHAEWIKENAPKYGFKKGEYAKGGVVGNVLSSINESVDMYGSTEVNVVLALEVGRNIKFKVQEFPKGKFIVIREDGVKLHDGNFNSKKEALDHIYNKYGINERQYYATGGGVGEELSALDRARLDALQEREDLDILTKSENIEYEALVEKYRKTNTYKKNQSKKYAKGGKVGTKYKYSDKQRKAMKDKIGLTDIEIDEKELFNEKLAKTTGEEYKKLLEEYKNSSAHKKYKDKHIKEENKKQASKGTKVKGGKKGKKGVPKRGKVTTAERKYIKAHKKEIATMCDAYPDLSHKQIIEKHKSA